MTANEVRRPRHRHGRLIATRIVAAQTREYERGPGETLVLWGCSMCGWTATQRLVGTWSSTTVREAFNEAAA